MEKLINNLVKYFLKNHPNPDDLAVSRLTKLLYLSDWKNAIENNEQITDSNWVFDRYGPYISEVLDMAKKDKEFKIIETLNSFGTKKQVIQLVDVENSEVCLNEEVEKIASFVIKATKDKTYNQFIKLVYSTYPIISSEQYSNLDLVESAANYRTLLESQSA